MAHEETKHQGWGVEGLAGWVGGGGGEWGWGVWLLGVIMYTNSLTHFLSDDSLSDKCLKTVLKQKV